MVECLKLTPLLLHRVERPSTASEAGELTVVGWMRWKQRQQVILPPLPRGEETVKAAGWPDKTAVPVRAADP